MIWIFAMLRSLVGEVEHDLCDINHLQFFSITKSHDLSHQHDVFMRCLLDQYCVKMIEEHVDSNI